MAARRCICLYATTRSGGRRGDSSVRPQLLTPPRARLPLPTYLDSGWPLPPRRILACSWARGSWHWPCRSGLCVLDLLCSAPIFTWDLCKLTYATPITIYIFTWDFYLFLSPANCSSAAHIQQTPTKLAHQKAKGDPANPRVLLSWRRRWVQQQVYGTVKHTHLLVSCRANRMWVRPPQPPARTKAHGGGDGRRSRLPLLPAPVPPASACWSADIRPQDLPQLKQRSREHSLTILVSNLITRPSMINGTSLLST